MVNLDSFRYQRQGKTPQRTHGGSLPRSTRSPRSPRSPRPTRSPRSVARHAPAPPAGALPLLLAPNLRLVFTGFNPGAESGRTGHHYAHPSNRFWKLLTDSGLTSEKLGPEQDASLLESHRFGFTDLVARCTRGIADLSKRERLQGAAALEKRLAEYRPGYVCFIGKGIWDTICTFKGWRTKTFQYGLQPHRFGETPVVVLPSTSGLVSIPYKDQLVWWRQLAQLVEAIEEAPAPAYTPESHTLGTLARDQPAPAPAKRAGTKSRTPSG